MVWEKLEEHSDGMVSWEYTGEGIRRVEKVPNSMIPCNACQKNWINPQMGQTICIFCKDSVFTSPEPVNREDDSDRVSIIL